MNRCARSTVLTIALSTFVARGVLAQPEPPEEAPDVAEAEQAQEPPPPRPVPDYDGRPPPPVRPAERAVLIPRVLLYPLYFVAEYVLRRPFGFLLRRLDPEQVLHFFRFGKDERFTLAPTFSYDFGFRPNVGLLFRARDVGAPGHSITAQGAIGGKRWYAGRITESYTPIGSRATYQLMAEGISRPDGLFFGIGGDVVDEERARYHWVGTEASASVIVRYLRQSRTTLRTGYRLRRFDDDVGDRISIEDRIAQGVSYGLPPGYPDGYSIWFAETRTELDTRADRPAPGDGVRLTFSARGAVDLRDGPSSRSFLIYGGSLAGFLDLSGLNHVLSLTSTVVLSEAIRGEIPFTELPSLAGDGPLGGFLRPFLIADSSAALSAAYTWPIWVFLDGKAEFTVGNAFDGRLDGFAPGKLRMSATIGVAAFTERVELLRMAFGIGTDEIEDGPNVEQVRVVIGASQTF